MHLLHIIPTYKPAYCYGGPVVSIGLLCENLVAKGNCQVTVLSTTANGKKELPVYKHTPKLVEGVNVYYFPRWTKDHSMLSPALLWYLFKNAKRFDAVHIHSWWNLSVLFATIVCILRGVKPVLSPRGMLSSFSIKGRFKPIFHKIIGTRLLKQTFLHSTSPQETKECLAWIPNWQHTDLPNFLDTPLADFGFGISDLGDAQAEIKDSSVNFRLRASDVGSNSSEIQHPKSEIDKFRLLFLSRIHEKKGVELLFDALAQVPFDWTLNMAGDGETDYLEQLKQRSKTLKIDHKINWLGWVNPNERAGIFGQADLLVLPSYNENFANVVIESLAAKTPVLVSKYVGLSEYIVKNDLGWVCDTTVESLKNTLIKANNQAEHRQQIAARASQQIQQDFDPSVLVQQYLKMYQKILFKTT